MNKVINIKNERSIDEVVEDLSINFTKTEQGIDLLAYSVALRV